MSSNGIDRLLEVLEKASVRPGSPAVIYHGHKGVWRTLRGFRVFIEDNGGKQGKILVGPPSLAGKGFGEIGSDTWSGLTPKATNKTFSGGDASNLKASIKNSLGADDTRHAALDSMTSTQELIPIARSAGFTDENIKSALGGQKINSGLGEGNHQATVTTLKPRRLASTPPEEKSVSGEPNPVVAPPEKPKLRLQPEVSKPQSAPAARPVGPDSIQGALALAEAPVKGNDHERVTRVADAILAAAKKHEDELLRRKLEALGYGLKSGARKLSDVRDELRNMVENRQNTGVANPSVNEVTVLHDRTELQDFLKNAEEEMKQHMEEKLREANGDRHRAQDLALEKMLSILESRVRDPHIIKEIRTMREGLRKKRIGSHSVLLRLLMLLRRLLAFIPG